MSITHSPQANILHVGSATKDSLMEWLKRRWQLYL